MKNSIGHQKQQSASTLFRASDSVDTLTTTATGSQHTGQYNCFKILTIFNKFLIILIEVFAEVVEVDYETYSDVESGEDTLKLTARGHHLRSEIVHNPKEKPRPSSRDETKKEIQEDDEATLRELLIRYWRFIYI